MVDSCLCTTRAIIIIIIIIIINEKISVAFSPKTARTRNTQKDDSDALALDLSEKHRLTSHDACYSRQAAIDAHVEKITVGIYTFRHNAPSPALCITAALFRLEPVDMAPSSHDSGYPLCTGHCHVSSNLPTAHFSVRRGKE